MEVNKTKPLSLVACNGVCKPNYKRGLGLRKHKDVKYKASTNKLLIIENIFVLA